MMTRYGQTLFCPIVLFPLPLATAHFVEDDVEPQIEGAPLVTFQQSQRQLLNHQDEPVCQGVQFGSCFGDNECYCAESEGAIIGCRCFAKDALRECYDPGRTPERYKVTKDKGCCPGEPCETCGPNGVKTYTKLAQTF